MGAHRISAAELPPRPVASVPSLRRHKPTNQAVVTVRLSNGGTHLWAPQQRQPATPWEAEIDRLMRQQVTTLETAERKRLYDKVQELVAHNLPMIFLVSPNILVGAKTSLGNFRPAVLDPHTLWNVEELFWRGKRTSGTP